MGELVFPRATTLARTTAPEPGWESSRTERRTRLCGHFLSPHTGKLKQGLWAWERPGKGRGDRGPATWSYPGPGRGDALWPGEHLGRPRGLGGVLGLAQEVCPFQKAVAGLLLWAGLPALPALPSLDVALSPSVVGLSPSCCRESSSETAGLGGRGASGHLS